MIPIDIFSRRAVRFKDGINYWDFFVNPNVLKYVTMKVFIMLLNLIYSLKLPSLLVLMLPKKTSNKTYTFLYTKVFSILLVDIIDYNRFGIAAKNIPAPNL